MTWTKAVPVEPSLAVTVTVMAFDPAWSAIAPESHEVVPVATPEEPWSLDHTTRWMPDACEAFPRMFTADCDVVNEPVPAG